jgi:hypothetical protein
MDVSVSTAERSPRAWIVDSIAARSSTTRVERGLIESAQQGGGETFELGQHG